MIIDLYERSNEVNSLDFPNYNGSYFSILLMSFLTDYGSIVALSIGFIIMYVEKHSNTIGTILTKPLYRDTLINGKLIGAVAFLLCLLILSSMLYSAGLLFVCGNLSDSVILKYIANVPGIVLFSLLYIMVFFSISLFFSTLIKDDSFALFFSILVWFTIQYILSNLVFSGSIALLISGGYTVQERALDNFIAELAPNTILYKIVSDNRDTLDFVNVLGKNTFEIAKLLLYVIIATVFSYIAFLRRDLS